ncbi:MAG: molybdopterin-dependent oxidoreductase, partial [Actinomycetota bacterium]|nr:molybdopterin-dependent oxidoreductase [Actinomycetota bacterium]
SCLPAVTGAYDEPGGGSLYSSTATKKGYNLARARRPELGARPRTLVMTQLGHNLTSLDDPPVEALVIWGANPVVSNPQVELVRQGLSRTDLFTVAIDIYPTETTAYADLVLPSAMQHEQIELNDAYNHRYLHWNESAVEPPGDCLPHTEIFRRLAAAMGYDEPELYATDEELAADLLDSDVMRSAGLTVDELRRTGYGRLPEPLLPRPGDPFPTPSGRFEFVSETAEADGHGRLPNYRPPLEADAGPDGTFALLATASPFHVNSTFAGTQHTTGRTSTPPVQLNPVDAAAIGVGEGDMAQIENDRGSFTAVVTISDCVNPGVAATTKGWWRRGLNNTVAERDADMGRGATFHDNRVAIRPVG